MSNRIFYSLSALVFLLCLGFRLASLNPGPLTYDEGWSLRAALGLYPVPAYPEDLSDDDFYIPFAPDLPATETFRPGDFRKFAQAKNIIPSVMTIDQGNGLLHVAQAFVWVKLLGHGDLVLRLNSLLYALLALLALLYGGRRFFGPEVSIGAGLLYAVHPDLIRYAVDFRQYSMALCLCFISSFLLLEILARRSKSTALISAYVLATAASFFTHYLTAYVTLGQILLCLLILRDRRRWLQLGLGGTLVLSLFAFWYRAGGKTGLKVMDIYSRSFAHRFQDSGIVEELFSPGNFGGELASFLVKIQGINPPYTLWGLLPAAFVLGVFVLCLRKVPPTAPMRFLLTLEIGSALYILSSSISYGHFVAFSERYTLFVVGFSPLVLASVLRSGYLQRARWSLLIPWAFVLNLGSLTATSVDWITEHRSFDWEKASASRELAAELLKLDPLRQTVVYPSWTSAVILSLALPESSELEGVVRETPGGFVLVRERAGAKETPIRIPLPLKGR